MLNENEVGNNEKIWCKISVDLEPKINLESQSTDTFFCEMINYLNDGLLPRSAESARRILHEASDYFIENDKLFHLARPGKKLKKLLPRYEQICVPAAHRVYVMQQYHSFAHDGFTRLYMMLRRFAYWKNMASELRSFTQGCQDCAMAQSFAKQLRVPLQPLPIARLFGTISIDHHEISFNKANTKYRYILVIVDHFSLNFRLLPCLTTNASETSKHLFNSWFMHYGWPENILSDRAAAFLGDLMKSLADFSGFKEKIFTSSHRAQSNSAAELIK